MGCMDHWHPVLASGALRDKPVKVRLNSKDIVLFRRSDGQVGAMNNACVHRRMDLSRGRVEGDRLVCPYHGWSFDTDGNAKSPGMPTLHANAVCFETVERHGAIWVKPAGVAAKFPTFDVEGYHFFGVLSRNVKVPVEILLDNFTEVEHTCMVHAMLGYDLADMENVVCEVTRTEESVRVFNDGKQKPVALWVKALVEFKESDHFVDDWTTYFDPIYTVYEQYWYEPGTKKERRDRYRNFVFFNPVDDDESQFFVFIYLKSKQMNNPLMRKVMTPLVRALVALEVDLDAKMLPTLADKDPKLRGMRLSRFDTVLHLQRQRIRHIYHGESKPHEETEARAMEPVAK